MNIVFFGTPAYSLPALKSLIKKHNVCAVVTNNDKPAGRGNKIIFPPVKEFALLNNIKVFQFENIRKENYSALYDYKDGVFITIAFGQILSQEIIDIPKYGVYNIHASLLPAYRGASPITEALKNGDNETGVTIMKTELGLDAGDIAHVKKIKIEDGDNSLTLSEKLSVLSAEAIDEFLGTLERSKISLIKQDNAKATYCKTIKKEDALIDFSKSNVEIHNTVRAYYTWPTAHFIINGNTYKVFETIPLTLGCREAAGWLYEHNAKVKFPSNVRGVARSDGELEAGKIISADSKNGLIIQCGKGLLEIITLQAAGKAKMNAKDYLRGNKLMTGG